jgi:hypothetical protein
MFSKKTAKAATAESSQSSTQVANAKVHPPQPNAPLFAVVCCILVVGRCRIGDRFLTGLSVYCSDGAWLSEITKRTQALNAFLHDSATHSQGRELPLETVFCYAIALMRSLGFTPLSLNDRVSSSRDGRSQFTFEKALNAQEIHEQQLRANAPPLAPPVEPEGGVESTPF